MKMMIKIPIIFLRIIIIIFYIYIYNLKSFNNEIKNESLNKKHKNLFYILNVLSFIRNKRNSK